MTSRQYLAFTHHSTVDNAWKLILFSFPWLLRFTECKNVYAEFGLFVMLNKSSMTSCFASCTKPACHLTSACHDVLRCWFFSCFHRMNLKSLSLKMLFNFHLCDANWRHDVHVLTSFHDVTKLVVSPISACRWARNVDSVISLRDVHRSLTSLHKVMSSLPITLMLSTFPDVKSWRHNFVISVISG